MKYYLSLNVNMRIAFKSCFELACGMSWESAGLFMGMEERIELLVFKLKEYGFKF
jgi:hypothetical protein